MPKTALTPDTSVFTLDAAKEPLGRLATKAAVLLMGKHRPSFERHRKSAPRVIVTNSDHTILTGRKWTQKKYYRHSGYIGNLKEISAASMRERDSRRIILLAIRGMLPKNKLRDQLMKRLSVYKGAATP